MNHIHLSAQKHHLKRVAKMDILDAFYHTVHDYPGGVETLASRMGMSPVILRNKANRGTVANKPMLVDANNAMHFTQDFRILRALAHQHGFLLVKAPDNAVESDMSVLESMTSTMMAFGAFSAEVHGAFSDGAITQKELKKVVKAGRTAMEAVLAAEKRVSGMAEK